MDNLRIGVVFRDLGIWPAFFQLTVHLAEKCLSAPILTLARMWRAVLTTVTLKRSSVWCRTELCWMSYFILMTKYFTSSNLLLIVLQQMVRKRSMCSCLCSDGWANFNSSISYRMSQKFSLIIYNFVSFQNVDFSQQLRRHFQLSHLDKSNFLEFVMKHSRMLESN